MNDLDKYIEKRKKRDPDFAEGFEVHHLHGLWVRMDYIYT